MSLPIGRCHRKRESHSATSKDDKKFNLHERPRKWRGRLTAVVDRGIDGAGGAGATVYHYDPATGRRTSVARPNGVTTSYSYDALGNIAEIRHANAYDRAVAARVSSRPEGNY